MISVFSYALLLSSQYLFCIYKNTAKIFSRGNRTSVFNEKLILSQENSISTTKEISSVTFWVSINGQLLILYYKARKRKIHFLKLNRSLLGVICSRETKTIMMRLREMKLDFNIFVLSCRYQTLRFHWVFNFLRSVLIPKKIV